MRTWKLSGNIVPAGLRLGASMAALIAAAAHAQSASPPAESQTPAAAEAEGDIVVTGSRLASSSALTANPVSVITSESIAITDTLQLDDITAKTPAFGSQGTRNTPIGTETGVTGIELRNLGTNRTLILVNGRRFTPTITIGGVLVNTDAIPVSLIDRVEVLRDGASPVYGSDAVAGVVNIITKQNYNGIEASVGTGISTRGDAAERRASITAGRSGDDWSIVANVNYTHRDGITETARAYSTRPVQDVSKNPDGTYTFLYGSPITPGGSTIAPDGSIVQFTSPTTFVPVSANGYEDNPANVSLVSPTTTYVGTLQGHYDITPNVQAFVEASYAHTDLPIVGQPPTFYPGRSLKYPAAGTVPLDNPYNILGNAFGVPIPLYREYDEVGPRVVDTTTETWRVLGGLRGDFAKTFKYEAFFGYGRSTSHTTWINNINVANLINSFDPVLCAAAPGCVVANPFGPNALTPAVANYIRDNVTIDNAYTQRVIGGSVNGDLLKLPAGPLSIAGGFEFRHEVGKTFYSPTVLSGDSSLTNARDTVGAFTASEGFGEVNVPLLADRPLFTSLSVNGAVRYSSYDTFGNDTTWKAGVNWQVTPDLRFRASQGTAFRAPAIDEFAGGTLNTFATYNDPCDATRGIRSNPTVAAACAAAGLPANFTQFNAKTLGARQGNPNLKPEKADETNAGAILTPRFAPGLQLSVDYYRISLKNAVFQPAATTVLDNCYLSGAALNAPECALFTRDARGQVNQINLAKQNIGSIVTDGFDFGASYKLALTDLGMKDTGHLLFNVEGNYLLHFNQQLAVGQPAQRQAGTFDLNGQYGSLSRARVIGSVGYSRDAVSLTYTLRYIQGSTANGGNQAQLPPNFLYTPDVYYQDVAVNFRLKHYDLVVGVQNLADRQPPFVFNGANYDPTTYDSIGRYFFVKATVRY